MFWAAPRRAPSVVEFQVDDPLHYAFVYNFALLWAEVWGIKPVEDCSEIVKVYSLQL